MSNCYEWEGSSTTDPELKGSSFSATSMEEALKMIRECYDGVPTLIREYPSNVKPWEKYCIGKPIRTIEQIVDEKAALDNTDLLTMSEEELRAEVVKLRTGIRAHRDCSGHNLCWYHPELWNLLPERVTPTPQIPPLPEFMMRCAEYRLSLEKKVEPGK